MSKFSLLAVAAAAAMSAGTASAATIDFESVALGNYSSVTDSGVTFEFTAGSGLFDVVDSGSPGAPISGHSLISYFANPGAGAFKASMAGGFSSFSIGMGDYNADDDEGYLVAYDAGGGVLDSDYLYVDPATYGGGMLTVSSATPIAYVLFYETGSYPGAVYWDNAEFSPAVPEPQTYALFGLGLAGLAAVARRRQPK